MDLKKKLRQRILSERKLFDQNSAMPGNEVILEKVQKIINSIYLSNIVTGLYMPIQGEPDLTKIMSSNDNRLFALPKIETGQMRFVYYQTGERLEEKMRGILQPVKNVEVKPNIIIAPGLAYSIKGYRLGFGTGYYDKYLSSKEIIAPVVKIGVCFDRDLKEYLPSEKHDVKFDYIVTDKIVLKL